MNNLETLLQHTAPVKLLRNSQAGPHVYPVVQSEYTNWHDEQRAWQQTCVLFNQSYHMTDMYVEGPDAIKLMSEPGFELFGPWDEGEAVKAILAEAGREFGLRLVGARAYSSNTLESGWIPSPMPAVYSGDKMKPYRQWLPANCYEAIASLGGSFYSNNIDDCYLAPWDLGCGPIVKFDHEFIGRAALEKMTKEPHRKKVTLALDSNEVTHALNTMFNKTDRAKYFDFPSAVYSTLPYDKVMSDGKTIGISTWCGYSSNEGRMLTLAIVTEEYAEPGTEVTFVWGEENGGSKKPTVERHVQTMIRATVSPVPYSEVARTQYAEGWRTHQEVARHK